MSHALTTEQSEPRPTRSSAAQASGWHAHLALGFERRGPRTVLARRKRRGPLAVQRPFYPEGERCHVYLLHPPGGIVGGDQITVDVDAQQHTECFITTPGAAKFYRSAGRTAVVNQTLKVAAGACVEWLPQENIYFTGCDVTVTTQVELVDDAAITLWDIQCFGRPANQEPLSEGHVDVRLEIVRDKRPLLLERARIDADNRHYTSLLGGQPVTAVLVVSHTTPDMLVACRDAVGTQRSFALTQMQDLLVARYLGDSTNEARKLLTQVWITLRQMKHREPVALPRIWST